MTKRWLALALLASGCSPSTMPMEPDPLPPDTREIYTRRDRLSVDRGVELIGRGHEQVALWSVRGDRDRPELVFTRLSPDGFRNSETRAQLGATTSVLITDFLWTGSEYAGLWVRDAGGLDPRIFFARWTPEGELSGDVTLLMEMPIQEFDPELGVGPQLVFDGTDYWLMWRGGTGVNVELFFGRIEADGSVTGVRATETPTGASPELGNAVFYDEAIAFGWLERPDVGSDRARLSLVSTTEARILRAGTLLGREATRPPDLVWTGTDLIATWVDGALKAARTSSTTDVIEEKTLAPAADLEHASTWTESGLEIVWQSSGTLTASSFDARLVATGTTASWARKRTMITPRVTRTKLGRSVLWEEADGESLPQGYLRSLAD